MRKKSSILLYTTLPLVGGNSTNASTLAIFYKSRGFKVVMLVRQTGRTAVNKELIQSLEAQGIIVKLVGGQIINLAPLEALFFTRFYRCKVFISIGMARAAPFLAKLGGFQKKYHYYITHDSSLSALRLLGNGIRHFDKIIVISPISAALVKKLSPAPREVEWIPQFSQLRQPHPIASKECPECPCFGFIGQLHESKGIQDLLRIWNSDRALSKLSILGDGPLKNKVLAAANADPRIVYVGSFSAERRDEALPTFFNSIDYLLVPSLEGEGMPTVILEALSCGCPVIASPSGGIAAFATGMLASLFGHYVQLLSETEWKDFPHSISLPMTDRQAMRNAYFKVFGDDVLAQKWLQLI